MSFLRRADKQLRPPSKTSQGTESNSTQIVSPQSQASKALQRYQSLPLTPDTVMQLSRVMGNRFANQMVNRTRGRVIQRLNTSESYYRNSVEKAVATESASQVIQENPNFKTLLQTVSDYEKLTRLPFKRAFAEILYKALAAVSRYALYLNSDLMEAQSKFGKAKEQLERMVSTAVDDVDQERLAIRFLDNDTSLHDGEMTWHKALFFARAGVSPTSIRNEKNLAAGTDTQAPQRGDPMALTGGNISEVTGLTFQEAEGDRRRVFKPNEIIPRDMPDGESIDSFNVQSSYRIMAVARVEALLRQKIEEAGRTFTSLVGNIDFAIYKGQIGTAADFAPGQEATKTHKARGIWKATQKNLDMKDIELQRQLANLQLFDIIIGQADRNLGNIMIDQEEGQQTKVTGIDQDFAFGNDVDINQNIGITPMPQLVDRYFAEALLAIDPDELKACLKGLDATTIKITLARFSAVRRKLVDMDGADQLIVARGDPKHPHARTWNDIDLSEYRNLTFRDQPKDYAGILIGNVKSAREAVKNDPSLQPEQDDKGRWVLRYFYHYDGQSKYLMARKPDGSDLFELVKEARSEAEAEAVAVPGPSVGTSGSQPGTSAWHSAKPRGRGN